jgi:precorrin-6B methylase 2
VRPTCAGGEPWGYRTHAHFAGDAQGPIGFRVGGSHEVIAVDRCLLLHPLLDELHEALDLELPELARLSLRAGIATEEQMLILETKGDAAPGLEVDVAMSAVLLRRREPPLILAGRAYIEEEVAGHRYRVSAESFFQVNTAGAEALMETVTAVLEPGPDDRLLDAYCGVGLFGLALAERVAEVTGIEAAPSACVDFLWNVEAKGLQNVALIEGPVEEVLAAWVTAADVPPEQSVDDDQEAAPASFGKGIDLAVVGGSAGAAGAAARGLRLLRPGHTGPRCPVVRAGRLSVGGSAAGGHVPADLSRGVCGIVREGRVRNLTRPSRNQTADYADFTDFSSASAALPPGGS